MEYFFPQRGTKTGIDKALKNTPAQYEIHRNLYHISEARNSWV